ncbi:hypothetical protein GQX73_g7426 [Xylaria multiplex]|uniref:Uncharacterized protein n=1 Tax=Xylaria multiplex TaxID=323545 RepID=A0A7C8N456_9PEZI|nr:hypothetical protein GQX73_g7426 [Xylaria multiplex]
MGGPNHAPAGDVLLWFWLWDPFLFLFLVMLPAAADKTWGIPPTMGLAMAAAAKSASRGAADRWLQKADGRTGFVIRSVTHVVRKEMMGVEAEQARAGSLQATSHVQRCILAVPWPYLPVYLSGTTSLVCGTLSLSENGNVEACVNMQVATS